MRIGVYVCHCGRNIADTVDVARVAEVAGKLPDVVVARDYIYICSGPGQELVRRDIAESGLNRVVIAACSPLMHQATFMNNVQRAGLSPYCLARANIREQCSWVHRDREEATEKARQLVTAAIAKVALDQPLAAREVEVQPSVLVIGGGIAGIEAAIQLGKTGFSVFLLEKESRLGGHAARLYRTFPDLADAGELLQARLEELNSIPGIKVLTDSEVVEVGGYVGNFQVKVRQAAVECPLDIGVIVVATGFETFDPHLKPEYGYGMYKNVITAMELERLASPSGPTRGKIQFDGREPGNVVFIQCVGSRDKSVGHEYCSRICCTYTAKQAHYIREKLPRAKVTVCYIDVRTFGKGHEQFYEKVQREGVIYRRGNVSEIYGRGDRVIVRAEDTLLGEFFEEAADLVVLATGVAPRKTTAELARLLKISLDADGFLLEAHPKLGPVETTTEGIVIAGGCQGPRDITDSVEQGRAAAAKASILLFPGKLKREPLVPAIDAEVCRGCRLCERVCAFGALVFDERHKVMTINEVLCRGCGACSIACPSGANQVRNFTKKQVLEMMAALT